MKKFLLILICILFLDFSIYAKILDKMDSTLGWTVGGESGTTSSIKTVKGKKKNAVELKFEFVSGTWVQMQKIISDDFSKVKVLKLNVKGAGYPNNLQVKLEDKDGTTYGKTYEGITSNDIWQIIIIPLTDLTYWWGGDEILDLKNISKIYLTVTTGSGGKGKILVDNIEILNKMPEKVQSVKRKYQRLTEGYVDKMESTTGWQVGGENDAKTSLEIIDGKEGKAIKMEYDFVNGKWLQMQKAFNLNLKDNKGFVFCFKSIGHKNGLQFKVMDEDGSTYGKNFPGMTLQKSWKEIKIPFNSLQYFWGGDQNFAQDKIIKIFFTVVAEDGGKGSIIIDELKVE